MKQVVLSNDVEAGGELVLQVVPGVLGPRIGPDVQKLIKAVREGNWSRRPDGSVEVAGRALQADEFTLRLAPHDARSGRALTGGEGVVTLDLVVTPELEAEGRARDVVRLVNEARREAGLHVADRIHLVLDLPDDVAAAVDHHRAYVVEETLADELVLAGPISDARRGQLPDGRAVHIGLRRTGDREPPIPG